MVIVLPSAVRCAPYAADIFLLPDIFEATTRFDYFPLFSSDTTLFMRYCRLMPIDTYAAAVIITHFACYLCLLRRFAISLMFCLRRRADAYIYYIDLPPRALFRDIAILPHVILQRRHFH